MVSSNPLLNAAYAPLPIDKLFYDRAALDEGRTIIDSFVIPIRSGRAWKVAAGHVFRISTPEGPQVGDLNLWNANDTREHMWAARTRQLQAAHVSVHDRLWSNLPFLRPLVTIVSDTLKDYGVDEDGGRVHDLLGTRCDPYVNKYMTGMDFDLHCHSNLIRAVAPYGLTEFDVHDVLNVFQCTGLNSQDQYFMKACPAEKGSYIEFFAEMDILAALSTCPGGDLSIRMWGDDVPEGGDPMLSVCRPLQVDVFKLSDDTLKSWEPFNSDTYHGDHGLKAAGLRGN
ncbi:hypothetical protein GLOTRDRAFT_109432 [Gloeophyllum trabeum ATCC 11539]|uniref:DUF1989 domain-containing protein n=1 Tax=Gloeophyllum trabeum (strain ATCC 11539 / FP-39264 / Madison 617) TaxID=670483 RepID=S7QG32_GLOTA|nr:uncharacterized protein GLOTRDRAFT_109432 [Gloeophyllum trabeum ATCC 11539]EPQ58841.1 hypothetical protein GLOTRDRAFT_109432 [Gloeophyllum trabeum ATCC 11539]